MTPSAAGALAPVSNRWRRWGSGWGSVGQVTGRAKLLTAWRQLARYCECLPRDCWTALAGWLIRSQRQLANRFPWLLCWSCACASDRVISRHSFHGRRRMESSRIELSWVESSCSLTPNKDTTIRLGTVWHGWGLYAWFNTLWCLA